MPNEPYLIRLAGRLLNGLDGMDDTRRERHRSFVLDRQRADGGFSGRQGESDLYYTSFAVRCLALLGALDENGCRRIGRFLVEQTHEQLNVIDLMSWLNAALAIEVFGGVELDDQIPEDWGQRSVGALERLRTDDGGYAKTEDAVSGSTYHSFLAALAYELIGQPIPQRDSLIQFVHGRRRDDGGFVEIRAMKRSGTNPTAAAVALLTMFDCLDAAVRKDVHRFLSLVKDAHGGFHANTRMPIADGLSTFTGLLTALEIGLDDLIDAAADRTFVSNELELATGGFRAASWDDEADVEYTYYGLGTYSLLSSTASG